MKAVYAKNNTIGSWVIRLFTFSKWSHVAVLIDEFSIIDSTARYGVRVSDFSDFKSKHDYVIIDRELQDSEAALDFLFKQVGKKYDWSAIFGIILQRNWQEDDKWFCAELWEAASIQGGTRKFRDDPYRITPQQSWAVN